MKIKNAKVECGDFHWTGEAYSLDEAIIGAFSKSLPKNPSILVRAKVADAPAKGAGWHYIDLESALKIAGYTTKKTKNGFRVL